MDFSLHNQSDTCQWNDSFAGDFLWTNSNFCEAICDVMTPATRSMWDIYLEDTLPSLPASWASRPSLVAAMPPCACGPVTGCALTAEKVL